MHRLSVTLVSRLMLNLRVQNSAQAGLPSSVESERRFRAALPVVATGSGRSVAALSTKSIRETAPAETAHFDDTAHPSRHAGRRALLKAGPDNENSEP